MGLGFIFLVSVPWGDSVWPFLFCLPLWTVLTIRDILIAANVKREKHTKRNGYVEISELTKDTAVPLCALSIGGARVKEHRPQKTTHIFAKITMLVDMPATNGVS